MNNSQPIELAIQGMHCPSCVRRLTAALQRLEEVDLVSVEVGRARLVAPAGEPTRSRILAAVSDAGFTAAILDSGVERS